MDKCLFDELERKVERLLRINMTLKQENGVLRTENTKLQQDRDGIRTRIDAILEKLQEVECL